MSPSGLPSIQANPLPSLVFALALPMTTFLPLDATTVIPVFPSFLKLSPDPEGHVKRVVMAILKARKIVVVCGE